MVFTKIKEFIGQYISLSTEEIKIDNIILYGENKLEYALSIKDYGASITILSDLTYDFFVVEMKSENAFSFKTKYFYNVDDLLNQIKDDLDDFVQLDKQKESNCFDF